MISQASRDGSEEYNRFGSPRIYEPGDLDPAKHVWLKPGPAWERFFAWRPCRVNEITKTLWMQFAYRRKDPETGEWEYWSGMDAEQQEEDYWDEMTW